MDLRLRHPETVWVNRAKSMDKINRDCPALVLSNNLPVMQELHLDYILGFLTSFMDLRQAE
eukprot:12882938-Prorocentrum_lima.AAC.1